MAVVTIKLNPKRGPDGGPKKGELMASKEEYDIRIEIIKIMEQGDCPRGHKVGDVFKYPEDLGKLCPTAFHVLYPSIEVLRSGGSFFYYTDEDGDGIKDTDYSCCPDYKRPVVFKMTRTKIKNPGL